MVLSVGLVALPLTAQRCVHSAHCTVIVQSRTCHSAQRRVNGSRWRVFKVAGMTGDPAAHFATPTVGAAAVVAAGSKNMRACMLFACEYPFQTERVLISPACARVRLTNLIWCHTLLGGVYCGGDVAALPPSPHHHVESVHCTIRLALLSLGDLAVCIFPRSCHA